MSDHSAIEWTDATWNPVRGCVKVSPGCANCYAETFAERWRGVPGHPYEQGFDLRLVPEKLAEPLKWKKPKRVFVNSMSDLFQDGVPDEHIDQAFAIMAMTPRHTYQVLTKRVARMRAHLSDPNRPAAIDHALLWAVGVADRSRKCIVQPNAPGGTEDWPLPNVWLGVSVENQHFADERIPLLLQTPAAVRFISAEPLLGPVAIHQWLPIHESERSSQFADGTHGPALDWVIVGGESGPGARPFDLAWARSIVQQCQAAAVPVFVKQLGSNPRERHVNGLKHPLDGHVGNGGWKLLLQNRKGGDMAEWPEDLQVREFPTVRL